MHQGSEQVQTMPVDPAHVILVDRHAMPVDEVEDLDGDFSAVLDAVAKLRSGKDAVGGIAAKVGDDAYHFEDRAAQEEMVAGDFVSPSHPASQLQQPADVALRMSCRGCDV